MSLINVMPAILEIAGLDAPATAMGISFREKDGLFSWIKKKLSGTDEDYIYAELDTMATLKAVLAPPWKYIYNRRDKTGQLYNIISDPLELNDRVLVETGESDRLKNALLRWADTTKRYPAKRYDVELSPEEKEKLKGLGYLQ
jgi:arylsulfatase A-like enzyme